MTEKVEIQRQRLQKILELFTDATELLEEIPEMQDQGRLSEVSQHIGAELEARITEMNKIENENPELRRMLNQATNQKIQSNQETTLKDLEQEIFGN